MADTDVVVVGAGIAGLAAAFRLQQRGLRVTVLEAEAVVAGKMASRREDGYVFNRGATILPSSYATLLRLAADAGVTAPVTPMRTVFGIPRAGRMHTLRTTGAGQVVDGLRTDLLSTRSKLLLRRLVVDALRAVRSMSYDDLARTASFDTETVAAYTARRLNREIHDYVIAPILRGIYLVEADQASTVDLFFTVTKLVGGGLLQYPAGMDFVPRALAARLTDVRLGARVTRVWRTPGGAAVEWQQDGTAHELTARGCVVAVCGDAVPELFPDMDPRQRDILRAQSYGAIIKGVFRLSRLPSGTPTVIAVPQPEDPDLGVVCTDSQSMPTSAPAGRAVVSGHWMDAWSRAHIDRSDAELLEAARRSMERVIPGFSDVLEGAHFERWWPAALASRQGMYADLARLVALIDPEDPVQLAGDYFGVPSLNVCATSGEQAAARVMAQHRFHQEEQR